MAGAIKAIIATQFDPTGIKKASAEFGKLGGSIKGALGAIGLTVGISALSSALKQATQQASNDNKAQILLAQQLRNTANATDEQIAAVERSIAKTSVFAGVADDQLRPALASLVRATGDVGQAQDLLSLSLDVSAATGKDLQSVSLAIGKAVSGQTTQLFRMIPALKGSDDFMGKLRESTKGMAEAAGNADPFMRLTIIFDEIQETIGFAVLPALQEFATWMASPEGAGKTQEFVDILVEGVTGLVNFAKYVADNIAFLGPLAVGLGVATTAFTIFNAVVAANPLGLAATGITLLLTGLVALGVEADKARVKYEKLNGARVRFGGGILDKEKAAIKAITPMSYGSKVALPLTYGKKVIPQSTVTVVPTPKSGAGSGKKSAADLLKEEADKLKEKAKEALKSFQDGLRELTSGFESLTKPSSELGQFQQTVVDTFDSINKKIAEGVANKTFSTKGLDKLRNFLKAQQNLLEENARQRDAIIEKRSLAKALFDEVNSSLLSTGSLASLLETQTKQVTTSVTKIIDGFTVTTRQTVDEVIGGKGVVSKLKEVVTKTKAFAVQLTNLKALGLTPDLFKQIVEAGPEVGGQLAKEILDGGSDSVKALNETFSELQTVTKGVAEQTAVVMFNAGVEIAGGLVEGLLKEEQRLVDAAKQLADAFNAAYLANIAELKVPDAPTVAPKVTAKTTVIAPKVTIKATPNTKADAQKTVSSLSKFYASNPIKNTSPFTYFHA